MKDLTFTTMLTVSYDDAVQNVREAFAKEGFGILTEIDVARVMKAKLDVELPRQIILGACRPQLAYAALQANPSVGALLPCNVVVRESTVGVVVEAIDPAKMLGMAIDDLSLADLAKDATARVRRAMDALQAMG